MKGKWAARAATMLALTWLVAPIFGQDDEPPVGLDLELGAGVGQMSLIRPGGCGGPVGQATNFVGSYGRLGMQSRPSSGSWQHRLVGSVEGDLRLHSVGDDEMGVIGFGRATVGWSSQYVGVSAGGWAGNISTDEALFGFGSLAIRLGFPDRYLRLSLFDQPGCYLAHCMLGVEGLWSWDAFALRGGFSGGLVGWRGYLQVPFQWTTQELWLTPGLELGMNEDQRPLWALTLGVRLPSL